MQLGGNLLLEALNTCVWLAARDRRVRVLLDLCFVAVLDVIERGPRPQELSLERMLLARVLVKVEKPLTSESGGRTGKVALVLLLDDRR